MAGGTDFHSHLVPGVDDGAATIDESLEALAAYRAAGITTAIVTPHFEGSITHVPAMLTERLAAIDAGWAQLTGDARAAACGVQLLRGVELMLDVPDPDVSDVRLRLGGTRFVLVEFPAMQLPEVNPEYAVQCLRAAGTQPVIAHPERYRNVGDALDELLPLRYAGALFQVNAGSLLGFHGRGARVRAETLLDRGWADYASGDFHARGEFAVPAAREALRARGGAAQDELLFVTNPARLARGESPLAVPPLGAGDTPKGKSWWTRLTGG